MTDYSQTDWPSLRQHRMAAVQSVMRTAGCDAILLMGRDNIRYATDFRAWLAIEVFDWYLALVTKDGDSYVFIPFVDEDVNDPDPELPWIRQFVAAPSWISSDTQPSVSTGLISRKLRALKVKKVGIESVSPALFMSLIQEMPNVKFVPIGRDLAMVRQVKHREEIRLLAASVKLASQGSNAALEFIAAGATDRDILGIATSTMFSSGAEFITHHLCLHREAADWFPHGTPLREGDTYVFDAGCYGPGGYGSDMCRTAVVGSPPQAIRDAYKVLMQAYGEGQATAKPAVNVSEIDALINGVLTKSGYPATPYSMGHGVGLRACELPLIYRKQMMDSDETLQEGMVICLEPETRATVGKTSTVVKVEDMFEVTSTGLRRLTDSRSEI